MDFHVNVTVEVKQVANALAIQTPVDIQLAYRKKRWIAHCDQLHVATDPFERMEEAIVAGASKVAIEMQASVEDRPVIAGRITPDNIPTNMF